MRPSLGPGDPRVEAERTPERGDKAEGDEELAPPYPGAGWGGCAVGRRRWGLCPEKMDLARTIILLCSWAAGAGGEGRPGPLGPRGLGRDVAFRLRLPPFPSRGRPALSPGRQAAAGPLPGALSPPPFGRPRARTAPSASALSMRLARRRAPLPGRTMGGRGGSRFLSPLRRSPFSLPELQCFPRRSPSSGLCGGAAGRFPPVRPPPSASPWGAPRSLPGRAVRADGRLRRRKRPCLGDAVPGPRPEETPFWVLPRDGEVWTSSRCGCFSALA